MNILYIYGYKIFIDSLLFDTIKNDIFIGSLCTS